MTPKFCFLLIHDGRGYKERCLASAKQMLPEPDFFVEVDDSKHELGFAGAIAKGWQDVANSPADYCFHVEEDFLFLKPVPLLRMMALLERNPHLAQVALKRQACNPEEMKAGGIVEACPAGFEQRTDRGDVYTVHRRFWTTNPSVFSTGFCAQGWPQVLNSEGIFTHRLIEDPECVFAYWGAKYDPPMVEHIGQIRAGHGY